MVRPNGSAHMKEHSKLRYPTLAISRLLFPSILLLSPGGAFATPPLQHKPVPVVERAASSSRTESIIMRFGRPGSASVREQYMYTGIFQILLRDRASKQPGIRACHLSVLAGNDFTDRRLTVSHSNPNQRDECVKGIVHFILNEPIKEADFLAARETKVQEARRWTSSMYPTLAVYAAERLAYLAIYEPHSPLHEIYSVSDEDISNVTFGSFNSWLVRNRKEGLITFKAQYYLMRLLSLLKTLRLLFPFFR
jgi:hypothetical protein